MCLLLVACRRLDLWVLGPAELSTAARGTCWAKRRMLDWEAAQRLSTWLAHLQVLNVESEVEGGAMESMRKVADFLVEHCSGLPIDMSVLRL